MERQTQQYIVKYNTLGSLFELDVRTDFVVVEGERSPVRFAEDYPVVLYVRVKDQTVDPVELIEFQVMSSAKGKRAVAVYGGGNLTGTAHNITQRSAVPFSASNFGTQFYVISPQKPLSPGEYCLSTKDEQQVFCFGIDPR